MGKFKRYKEFQILGIFIIVTLVMSIFYIHCSFAEPAPPLEWTKTFGGELGDFANAIAQTSDGGCIIIGYTESFGAADYDYYLIKTDASREMVWSRRLAGDLVGYGNEYGYSVQQTQDGGYIVAGRASVPAVEIDGKVLYLSGAILIKTDSDGAVIWRRQYRNYYPNSQYDIAYDCQQTKDGGYIFVGATSPTPGSTYPPSTYDVLIVKTDASGTEEWHRIFGGSTSTEIGYSVQQTRDGGYIITGSDNSNVSLGAYLIKINALGSEEWSRKIYVPYTVGSTTYGNAQALGRAVHQAADGGYIIAGYAINPVSQSGTHTACLIKTDSNGNVLWTQLYGTSFTLIGEASSVQQTQDGGYIVAGRIGGQANLNIPDVFILKTDSYGNKVWDMSIGGIGEDSAASVLEARDGGYIAVGSTKSFGSGNADVYLIKVSSGTGPTNQLPLANAGSEQSVHVDSIVTLDGSESSDPDGNVPLSYDWRFISLPVGSMAVLSDPKIVNPTFRVDLLGDYVLQLVVTDSLGAESAPDTVTISTLNSSPVAAAGSDQSITIIGTEIELNGAQSYDPDGDAITYQWAFVSIPIGSVASLNGATTATPAFVADVHGDYTIRLVVSDPWAQSPPDTVTVSFENIKPVANAGTSQSVVVGDTVTLNGSGSSDVNGDRLTYKWRLASVPEGSLSAIADPTAEVTTFVPDLTGAYVVQLIVNDGYTDSDPGTHQVEAITLKTIAIAAVQAVQAQIALLNLDAFKNANMQNTFLNKLNAVIASIAAGNYADALGQLQNDILAKTDGCVTTGTPDKNDWIKDCESQGRICPCLLDAITKVKRLLQ